MTISFDAIWIPGTITVLAAIWSAFCLWPSPHVWALVGWPFVIGVGVLLPAVPTLAAWALYFALT